MFGKPQNNVCVFVHICGRSQACIRVSCWLHDSVEDSTIGFTKYGFGHRQNVTLKMSLSLNAIAAQCSRASVNGCMLTHSLTAHSVKSYIQSWGCLIGSVTLTGNVARS